LLITFLKGLRKPTIIFSMILIFTIVITYIICLRIGFDPEALLDDLGVGSVTNQKNPGAFELFTAFFINKIQVPLQILLLSLIPIPFIYTLVLLVNGIMIGAVFYIYQAVQLIHGEGDALYLIILKDFLPHAVIELLGFIIATAIAYRVNQWIMRNIINLFRQQTKLPIYYTLKQLLYYSALTFAFIILPLILLAAMIESYITPII